MKTPLVLDIDFTLIHLEFVPGAIEVPGRTRSAWLAPQTVAALAQLQARWEIVLATARSWDGTRPVCDGLNERGVCVQSAVTEDGARLGQTGALRAFAPDFDAARKRQIYAPRAAWPRFEWQLDFQSCAVARCETAELAAQLMAIFAARLAPDERLYRDGRKVYVLPQRTDKWSALQHLLGERAHQAAGVGDGENDLAWLPNVARPATFVDANGALIEAVRARRGCIGGARSHAAIAEILRAFDV